MDGTMNFVWSDQVQLQHPASLAGHDPHQHQAGQRLHPPVLESAHKNQHASSSIPSSSSCQPANIQPHQHHHHYQLAAGFNGPFSSPPLCHVQPRVVQQTPLPLSTVQFPPGQKQSEQSLQQIREASERYFESMQQLLQLQYQHTMESINQQFHLFSLYWSTRQQPHNSQPSISTVELVQDSSPHQESVQHTIGATVVCEQQPSMDQLIVPAPTTATTVYCAQQQQQQKEGSKISNAVPTPGGSSENEFEYVLQSPPAAEVFNSFNVGSRQEADIIFDQRQPINIKCIVLEFDASTVESIISFYQINPKFIQHLLDRNGHRMDSTSERASVSSDVFVWLINHGGIKVKLRVCTTALDNTITGHSTNTVHHHRSSNARRPLQWKHRQRFSGGDVENH